MTPDRQEAESHKYSSDGIIVLPLASGRWAIFNREYRLHTIVDEVTNEVLRTVPLPKEPQRGAAPDLTDDLDLDV